MFHFRQLIAVSSRRVLRFLIQVRVLTHLAWGCCLLWTACGMVLSARADDPPPLILQADTIERVVERVEPSVVSILRVRSPDKNSPVVSTEPTTPNFRLQDGQELLPNDYGAGILVKAPDGNELFVLTAYHVVRGAMEYRSDRTWTPAAGQSELQVTFQNRRKCAAAIFAADPRSDLAVLAFDAAQFAERPADLKPLEWRTEKPARKGEIVVCFGNPYALARDGSASVSWGIISNIGRRPVMPARTQLVQQYLFQLGTVLQIDARLQLGGSGGPVVNLNGELVGISTALAAIEGYEKSAGFAIPVAPPMRRVVETLLAGQEVEYGLLGVTPGDFDTEEMRRIPSLYARQPSAVEVLQIPRESPAYDRLRQGDILLAIDDQTLYSSTDLMRIVGEKPPESEVAIQLYRPNQNLAARSEMLTVRSKLGKWPVRDDEGIIASRPKYPSWRGLRVDYTSSRQRFVDQQFLSGVIVVDVTPTSPAAEALLQPGDVITRVGNVSVQSPAEFQRAVQNLRGNVSLQLHGRDAHVTLAE